MKIFRKILSNVLAICTVLSSLALFSCNQNNETDIGTPPDYSASDKRYEFYAYHPMNNGTYSENGETIYTGKDFRTLEYFQDYVDTGMDIFYLQAIQYQYEWMNGGDKETFETSDLKKYMDMAQEAGAKKTILIDWRIYQLSQQKTSLVGDDTALIDAHLQFATQDDLKNYIISCVQEYENHDTFWGILLDDEPTWEQFESSKQIFGILREYNSDIHVIQNILPMYGTASSYSPNADTMTREEYFEEYLREWQKATQADYLMFDTYPMQADGIESWHLKGMRIGAEVCKDLNLEFYVVGQTHASMKNGVLTYRATEKSDLYWQMNMMMGFGVVRMVHYTYFRISKNDMSNGWYYVDGSSFISSEGEKTELYYTMTEIMAEMQKLGKVLLNFKYNATACYTKTPLDFAFGYGYSKPNDTLQAVKSVTVEQGDVTLVNELYDNEKENYVYMVQNIIDPIKGQMADTSIHAEIEFDAKYDYVAVYYKGEVHYERLENHKYETTLSAGYAEFLLPY